MSGGHVANNSSFLALPEKLLTNEQGVVGYAILWLMGIPAGVLFLIFLLRGCN
jgi:hypothetical protein